MPEKKLVGTITHFFSGINVAVVKLGAELKEGDNISIEGASTDIKQKAASMQIDRKPVKSAKKGESVGLKVGGRVRENDKVYKVAA